MGKLSCVRVMMSLLAAFARQELSTRHHRDGDLEPQQTGFRRGWPPAIYRLGGHGGKCHARDLRAAWRQICFRERFGRRPGLPRLGPAPRREVASQ